MDHQAELRGFLSSRRARISPKDADVPVFAGARRVPGLRREEVAHLAGVSVDYYTRLERGKVGGVSDEVLAAVARALQLEDVERDHLFHLAHALRKAPVARRPRVPQPRIRPQIQRVLDAISVPAFVQNARLDLTAANAIGWAVYPQAEELPPGRFNHLRFQLLDPRAHLFYRNWDLTTGNAVALLRAAAARDPLDEEIITLVGELSTQSDRFRQLWATSHDVLRFGSGVKRYNHPLVGHLSFDFETFDVAGEPGMVMLVYTPTPETTTADAMQLLANWHATEPAPVADSADAIADGAPGSGPG